MDVDGGAPVFSIAQREIQNLIIGCKGSTCCVRSIWEHFSNFQKDGKQPKQENGAQAGVTDASCFSDNSFNCRPEQRGVYRGCGKKAQECGDAEKLISRICKTKKP